MAENFFPWVSKLGAPGKVLANAIAKTCGFNNDTNYPVTVILHDGNVELNPGESMENWIVTGFSVYLVMHFPKWEPRIEFPSTEFNNMEHNLSAIFADKIKKFEDDKAVAAISKYSSCGRCTCIIWWAFLPTVYTKMPYSPLLCCWQDLHATLNVMKCV